MKRWLISILFAMAVIVVVGFIALRHIANLIFPDADTNPAHYAALLARWKQSGLTSWFPASIPADAKNVHFFTYQAWGQEGAEIQLRMQLPPAQVASIEADARAATTHIYDPDHRSYLEGAKNYWPVPDYYVGDRSDEFKFPATFKVYVIKAVDRGVGTWDPHDSYGVAISMATNEVVYWADQ